MSLSPGVTRSLLVRPLACSLVRDATRRDARNIRARARGRKDSSVEEEINRTTTGRPYPGRERDANNGGRFTPLFFSLPPFRPLYGRGIIYERRYAARERERERVVFARDETAGL